MKKLVCIMAICISLSSAIEYSLRLRSLGTDFAYLIPDYITDLYLNPDLIGQEKVISTEYSEDLYPPILLRFITGRFAWMNQYWGHYERNVSSVINYDHTVYTLTLKDAWIADFRNILPRFIAYDAWNLSNDLSYYCNTDQIRRTRRIEAKYFFSGNDRIKLNSKMSIITRAGVGLYRSYYNDLNMPSPMYDLNIILLSARSGVYYRDQTAYNRFTSFYIDIGGPLTTYAVDHLPYSLFPSFRDGEGTEINTFARTLIGQCGFGKSIPIADSSFLCLGMSESFLIQGKEEVDTFKVGINNYLSLPIALEYKIQRIWIRFGLSPAYKIWSRNEWNRYHSFSNIYVEHNLELNKFFGLHWQPTKKFGIDLYKQDDYRNFSWFYNWSVCLDFDL